MPLPLRSIGARPNRRPLLLLFLLALIIGAVQWERAAPGVAATAVSSPTQRLIVQLADPPLARWALQHGEGLADDGRLAPRSEAARHYRARLTASQAALLTALAERVPEARAATYIDESGRAKPAAYHVVFNGLAVEIGELSVAEARSRLRQLPGVVAVYPDRYHAPALYESVALTGAPALWADSLIGGQVQAGAGVKVASLDGGVHHAAPMFDGTGFAYPPGYPLGDTANTNGKIIVSRAYFRPWDLPTPGDENTWPGINGTSHGVHTAATAVGNDHTANFFTFVTPMSGVAAAAHVMSYRVFYASTLGIEGFYTVEALAALEDIVLDGADVVNNSWGGGPTDGGGADAPLDQALLNADAAGVFVAMAAGNAGPNPASTTHPSADYITVGATTSSGGNIAFGELDIIAPSPLSATLQAIPYGVAAFSPAWDPTEVFTYPLVAAPVISPANANGCAPWPAGSLSGQALLVERAGCFFATQTKRAQDAGAAFVVSVNTTDEILVMLGGNFTASIPAIVVGQSDGQAILDWFATHGAATTMRARNGGYALGTTPDVVATFSSRGPGVGNVLKPDLVAPGDFILAQGYQFGATGEARHLGYGWASGTSMATPHVAGAAALLRQARPSWDNADIKAALMGTAQYQAIYLDDGSPAQPLDAGAGRLDLTRAADPGLLLDPPSLSFGLVPSGTVRTLTVTVRSVATATQTYTVSLLDTTAGFPGNPVLPGVTVGPTAVVLPPGATASVPVHFDPVAAGYGDRQGYVLLQSADFQSHAPLWGRVTYANPLGDILFLDNDGSGAGAFADYLAFYTVAAVDRGYSYAVIDVDVLLAASVSQVLDPVTLLGYPAVVLFTGDNDRADLALPMADQFRLNEYAQNGGAIIAAGQNLSRMYDNGFFLNYNLGGQRVQEDVGGPLGTTFPITPTSASAFAGLAFDLGSGGDGAGNQVSVDELASSAYLTVTGEIDLDYTAVLQHRSPTNMAGGAVSIAHRDQPALEAGGAVPQPAGVAPGLTAGAAPGVAYNGRSLFLSFGLEGVNSTPHSRADLLARALQWTWDTPYATLAALPVGDTTVQLTAGFTSTLAGVSPVSYRWDFGDGTPFTTAGSSPAIVHTYPACAIYPARVEVVDSLGNHALGRTEAIACVPTAVAGANAAQPRTSVRFPTGALWSVLAAGLLSLVFLGQRRRAHQKE